MPENARQTIAGTLLLLAGGAIGAGLGLLFAPQSGKKTRKQVARYGRQVRGEAEEIAHRAAESIGEFVDEMGDKTGALASRGGEIADDMRKNLLSSLESAQKSLDKQRQRLTKIWG